jgi:Lysyl oxidase
MMRTKTVLSIGTFVIAATAIAAACDKGPQSVSAPEAASAQNVPWTDPPGNKTQDLDGLPDLIVDTQTLSSSWVVREEEFVAGQCGVEEGNIPGGEHRSLRFSVLILNMGTADLFVGDPLRHMDPNGDGNYADQDSLFEFASCHRHFHFRNYAKYELFPVNADGSLGTAIQARKRGFCMLDTTPAPGNSGEPKTPYYRLCGNQVFSGSQGISVNYGDIYKKSLPGQLFLLDDANEPVPPGPYVIRVTANPPFARQAGRMCPVQDSHGMCHMFAELNYDNNVGEVRMNIPTGVGKNGVGPGQGTFKEALDVEHHPEANGQSGH